MTPEYVAGLIDGEGCIDCQVMYPKRGYSYYNVRPRLRVAMTQSAGFLLEQLEAAYGGYISYRRSRVLTQNDSMSWEIAGKQRVTALLEAILPHLVLKKEQAKLALWWLQNVSGKHVSEEVRRTFSSELKQMKLDPQRLSEEAVLRIEELMRQSKLYGDVETSGEIAEALA